ncbi:MAG: cell filamentation protein Fic [Anaerotruncus sp.]|nr:cell filamentation protein Fic [Anaerotruncus sp.]
MEQRYHMTVEQNIFVAKRNIVDYIWKSAKLEGLGVTYPDTEAIFNGMSVAGVKVSDIVAVNNLKHAWQFVLENATYPVDYPYICQINRLVGGDHLIFGAGYLRKVAVSIGGTTWKPEIPSEDSVKEELSEIGQIVEPQERAVTLMLYIMRRQMFLDGNKRTAMLAANAVMIAGGCGILTIPVELQPEFTKMLVQFYETAEMEPLKNFLYEFCIDGIDFEQQFAEPDEKTPGIQLH